MNLVTSPKTKLTLKVIAVGVISLLMLIPLAMISDLIRDRQNLYRETAVEVGDLWGKEQTISGPVLTFRKSVAVTNQPSSHFEWDQLLPERLNVDGSVVSKKLHRNIYDVMVYNAKINITGFFKIPKELYSDEFISFSLGIADLRGIEELPVLQLGEYNLEPESGLSGEAKTQGLTVIIPKQIFSSFPVDEATSSRTIPFAMTIALKGSEGLYFTPVGKSTEVKLSSDYPDPSFAGNFLPSERKVDQNGFQAQWNISHLTRNYGQHQTTPDWFDIIEPSKFGVDLIIPVSDYQKAERAAKYGILIILLTFVVIFFTDQRNSNSINLFNYLLSALALVLFYALLVSLSEYLLFSIAYIISAVMTISLLCIFIQRLLKNREATLYIGGLLTAMYIFIFVLLQMKNYALLAGTIGLFVILSCVMHISSKQLPKQQ